MARLLLFLACARGAAGIMDALDIKAVCEVPTDGGPRMIYLDMDAEAFETLAGPPGPGNAMSLPIETSDCEPFKSAYINFSPGGHPAWDGRAPAASWWGRSTTALSSFRSSTPASSGAARATAKLPSTGGSGPRLATATSSTA